MKRATVSPRFTSRMAIARGVLVLEENLLSLQSLLKEKNFRVQILPQGTKDDEQLAMLLEHRVLITQKGRDFLEMAAIHEFSIIDTAGASQDMPTLAKHISEAWSSLRLKGYQPFILRLNKKGPASLEPVE